MTDLSVSGADRLHPLGLRPGLQQSGADAVLHGFLRVLRADVGAVLDVQVLCGQLSVIVFLSLRNDVKTVGGGEMAWISKTITY